MKYKNPIIPGFNPDPSICRVDDDFYLVTSTFEFFPGVPIYHSKNLINWKLINYCLTTDIQLPLQNTKASSGIYAPTIRYHDGTFFMTTTNVGNGGNFIVHTNNVYDKWSEPVFVAQRGIDPSLFWDDDGLCYFISNGSANEGDKSGIYMCEINPFTGKMNSPSRLISVGCGGRYPEAPHVYKRNGWYYLLLAEGGTEYGHMVTIQRARDLFGPYEKCPRNPILSHRDHPCEIQATGHADIVEDQNGNYWLVCLAIRPIPHAKLHHLGRETFLAPVVWGEDDWPIVGLNGKIDLEMDCELPSSYISPISLDFDERFNGDKLDLRWNFVRNPKHENYVLSDGNVVLKGNGDSLSTPCGQPTMLAVRQQEFCVETIAFLQGDISEGQHSGLTAFYNNDYHYDVLITKEAGEIYVCLRKKVADIDVIVARKRINYQKSIRFMIKSDAEWYSFYYETEGNFVEIGRGKTALLATEATHPTTYTGVFFGIFTENGEISLSRVTMRELK
jgi:alpha-N-arabinofuranosidase